METKTPIQFGYSMPAEWAEHEAVWIAWPKNLETFYEIEGVERCCCEMIGALSENEKVNLLVDNNEWEERVLEKLQKQRIEAKNAVFYHIKTVDVWTRDYAPIFVKNLEGIAAVKWIFNAWSGKYERFKPDDQAGEEIAKAAKMPVFKPGIILEGGSIDCNGRGTCLATEQCLLNKNRNPGLFRKQIEQYLESFLGVKKVIWLWKGIAGDSTDGHVDDFARFVRESTVICATEENEGDENNVVLKKNLELLKESTDANGNALKVIELPMPDEIEEVHGRKRGRLPASYANFYIANKAVLVPVFNQKKDEEALGILKKVFASRKVIGIDCRALIRGGGGIHCITQQQPSKW